MTTDNQNRQKTNTRRDVIPFFWQCPTVNKNTCSCNQCIPFHEIFAARCLSITNYEFSFHQFIIILFDQWYKEDQTQVLSTCGVFSYTYIHYYIILRMHKKNTILSYNIAENSKRVNRNEEKVCVCVCVCVCGCWMVFG